MECTVSCYLLSSAADIDSLYIFDLSFIKFCKKKAPLSYVMYL